MYLYRYNQHPGESRSGCSLVRRAVGRYEGSSRNCNRKVKETVKEKLYDASETFDEVQDWTIERVGEILENFSAYKPVIKEAGFEVGEIAVEVGLIPKLIVTFKQLERINEEKKNEMLEE